MNKYHLYYSRQQQEQANTLDNDSCRVFGKLENGKIVEYTEATLTKHSNWEDAVYLGVGYFHHVEQY